jgi:hypothetical protein
MTYAGGTPRQQGRRSEYVQATHLKPHLPQGRLRVRNPLEAGELSTFPRSEVVSLECPLLDSHLRVVAIRTDPHAQSCQHHEDTSQWHADDRDTTTSSSQVSLSIYKIGNSPDIGCAIPAACNFHLQLLSTPPFSTVQR